MEIKAGVRLRSAVCTTEAIVVRAPGGELDVRCGGKPMVAQAQAAAPVSPPEPPFDGGTLMGKRYADEASGIELLVTKAGSGSLSIGETALPVKDAKALPSSD